MHIDLFHGKNHAEQAYEENSAIVNRDDERDAVMTLESVTQRFKYNVDNASSLAHVT